MSILRVWQVTLPKASNLGEIRYLLIKFGAMFTLISLMRELQHLNRFNHNLFQAKKKGFAECVARDTRTHIKMSAKIAVQNAIYELKLLLNRYIINT